MTLRNEYTAYTHPPPNVAADTLAYISTSPKNVWAHNMPKSEKHELALLTAPITHIRYRLCTDAYISTVNHLHSRCLIIASHSDDRISGARRAIIELANRPIIVDALAPREAGSSGVSLTRGAFDSTANPVTEEMLERI